MGYILRGFLFFIGPLAFMAYVPSDDPKSWRSQLQFWIKNDFVWKYTTYLAIWGGGVIIILLGLWSMM
jgi:hypothetical protein